MELYGRMKRKRRKMKKWIIYSISIVIVLGLTQLLVDYETSHVQSEQSAVTSKSGKTRSTIYTAEKIRQARENIKKYDWAKKMRNVAVSVADSYLKLGNDYLWSLITSQALPRSYAVNQDMGSPVTGKGIDTFGQFPYKIDPVARPWKIIDPSSGYQFPTNDFAAYYKSGLNASGKFDPGRADKRYLVNKLYPEKGATWGVDDGYGWVDDQGNRFTFIAYYNHELWNDFIFKVLINLRDAYLYTGNQKYADAGIIMLDRIADLYPEMDTSAFKWEDGYRNSSTITDRGKILGSIMESEFIRDIISCYDAFFPAIDNKQANYVRYLSKQAKRYKLGPMKQSADGVKTNIEYGLIRQIYPAVKNAQITGNFGMPQSALTMAAVVLDEPGTTEEWLRFVFQTGGLVRTKEKTEVTGGGVLSVLMDQVDTDGYGNEGSPHYNVTWLANLKVIADILEGYDRNPFGDLYDNVKFKKMLSSFIDLTMVGKYTPQIGDSGSVGSTGLVLRKDVLLKGFEKYKDPKLAQALYFVNGNSFSGIHGTIFSADLEKTVREMKEVIRKSGQLQLNGLNLTGYGFAALRDGKTTASHTGQDKQRDIWMYYGRNGESHPHKDTLNIGVHAFGLDLAPDMGYVTFADPNVLRYNWESNTISHNTVVVDRAKQEGKSWVGVPLHFHRSSRVQWIDVKASNVYPQTSLYRRTTAMIQVDDTNSYGIDFFRVQGGNDHVFSFHGAEANVTTEGLRLEKQNKGTYAGDGVSYADSDINKTSNSGFNYLYNVERDNDPAAKFSVDWQVFDTRKVLPAPENIHLRLTMLGDVQDVALADGDPPQNKIGNPRRLKFLVAHRAGDNLSSVFTSVIEPYRNKRFIQSIDSVEVTQDGRTVPGDEARAVKVTLTNGRVDYIISSTNTDQEYTIAGGIRFKGSFGVYSERSGEPEYGYVSDGIRIGRENSSLFINKPADNGSVEGTVEQFTKGLNDSNEITIRLNGELTMPEVILGKFIYIDNDYDQAETYNKARNASYEIVGIKGKSGDTLTLEIGDITLVRGWKDPSDYSSGYEYNISEGDHFRIPLSWERK